jgi:PKD repeat protein
VTFDNTSSGVISGETTWLWDFGDGTTDTVRNPAPHTYVLPVGETEHSYTVTLTMTTPAGTDSVQHSFTVPPPPG